MIEILFAALLALFGFVLLVACGVMLFLLALVAFVTLLAGALRLVCYLARRMLCSK